MLKNIFLTELLDIIAFVNKYGSSTSNKVPGRSVIEYLISVDNRSITHLLIKVFLYKDDMDEFKLVLSRVNNIDDLFTDIIISDYVYDYVHLYTDMNNKIFHKKSVFIDP